MTDPVELAKLIHVLENSGEGCMCHAHGSNECACRAQWAEDVANEAAAAMRDLRARVEELEVAADTLLREKQLVEGRLATAREGLREIVVGRTQADFAAGQEHVGEVCAGRLCRIARTTLTAIGGDDA